MTLLKTADLAGPLLDAAVARAEQRPAIAIRGTRCYVNWHVRDGLGAGDEFNPSSSWSCGGPIIQQAGISVLCDPKLGWRAGFDPEAGHGQGVWMKHSGTGDTALIAAMRAYVASHLGEAVDLDE